jgi:hypothetical protein
MDWHTTEQALNLSRDLNNLTGGRYILKETLRLLEKFARTRRQCELHGAMARRRPRFAGGYPAGPQRSWASTPHWFEGCDAPGIGTAHSIRARLAAIFTSAESAHFRLGRVGG